MGCLEGVGVELMRGGFLLCAGMTRGGGEK